MLKCCFRFFSNKTSTLLDFHSQISHGRAPKDSLDKGFSVAKGWLSGTPSFKRFSSCYVFR
jgi:hypothetical protein